MAVVRVNREYGDKTMVGTLVTVVNNATSLPASLFSDSAGLVPLANPVTVNANGRVAFYVEPGSYTMTGGGLTRTITVSAPAAAGGVTEEDLALKQDAATAATDAELTSGLATKQDASTAATDAELAAAVAAIPSSPFVAGAGARSAKMSAATAASGADSTAEGTGTTASASAAHAEGNGTTASAISTHAEGEGTTASGQRSHAEGHLTTASAVAAHAEGQLAQATGQAAHAEGASTIASGIYSHAQGRYARSWRYTQDSQASIAFAVEGDVQTSVLSLALQTSDATPGILTAGGVAPVYGTGTSVNVLSLPTNVAYAFELLVVAKRSGAFDETAMWKITGLIVRTNNGTARLVGANTVETRADAAASAWTCVASADNTNKALAITVTGEAAKNITWHARLQTSEVAV
jgi:hypothetical protein